MRLASRSLTTHAALVLLEFLVGLLAVLATVVALLLAGVLVRAVPVAVEYAGGHPAFGTVAGHLLAVAAFLLLLACVRSVVVEYRRFAGRAPEIRQPIALTAGPALGLAIPVGYALQVAGSVRLPMPLLALAVASAHALAFRTISVWSRNAELAPLAELAGVLAGGPTVFALVTLVTRALPGPLDAAGRILLELPGWGLVPRDGPFLAAFPLLVATAFGLYRRLRRGDRVDVPEPDVPRAGELLPSVSLPSVPSPPVQFPSLSLPDAVSRPVGRRFPDVTLTDVALAATSRLAERSSRRLGRTDDGVPRDAPPVPRPAGLRSGGSDGSASSSGDDSPGPRAPRSATADSSSSRSAPSSSGSPDRSPSTSSDDDSDSAGGDGTDADGSATSSDDGGQSEADTPAEASAADDAPDTNESGSADETPDGSASTPEDAESRTRIFSAGVGDGSGDAVVETCPDCDADVPSDGTYEFCPLCGHEL